MKTGPCTKCSGVEIVVCHLKDQQGESGAAALSAAVRQGFWGAEGHGQLQAYVCRGCGYAELWVADPATIPIGNAYGTRWRD